MPYSCWAIRQLFVCSYLRINKLPFDFYSHINIVIMTSALCCLAGQVDEKFKKFAPIYRKQYSLAYLSKIRDELEQRKEERTQYLKQRVGSRSQTYLYSCNSYEIDSLYLISQAPPESGKVLYEELVRYFDDGRKWKERYIVMRACFVLECHESYKVWAVIHHLRINICWLRYW